MKSVRERPPGAAPARPRRGHGKAIDPSSNIAMLRRMLRASYKHLDVADPAELRELLRLQGDLAELTVRVVASMRQAGITWQEIGDGLGVTRQAALMRWGPQIAEDEYSRLHSADNQLVATR